jgi:hypothetical protein
MLGFGRFFSFLIIYTVDRTRTRDEPGARLPTHRATQTRNKHTQTSMPQVGFELIVWAGDGQRHCDWQARHYCNKPGCAQHTVLVLWHSESEEDKLIEKLLLPVLS